MEKLSLKIADACYFTSSVFSDERGSFSSPWENSRFEPLDFHFRPSSFNYSHNIKRGTIRAFHFQTHPQEQAKLVSCISGRIWDVLVDLREGSPTQFQWDAIELTAGDGKSVFIPPGCAHGFATLEDHSTVAYLIEGEYAPEASSVFRWNDPSLRIPWPIEDPILSEKDTNAPLLFK